MTLVGTVGTISSFQRRKHDAFYWEIDGFSKLSDKVDTYYQSPYFHFRGHRSLLKFYPNGVSSQSKTFFHIYFFSLGHDASSSVQLTLGLKTRNGGIEKCFSRNIIYPEEHGLGSAAVIRRIDFLKRITELAPSDRLTFGLLLGPTEMIRDIADRTETAHAGENGDKEKIEKKGCEKVLDDIAELLTSGDKSDATILVDKIEFKVHSCILAARTPVFAALFEHDTLEKHTRKITITDCEPAIFEEFLSHIYTGSVQNLGIENAIGVYQVADKYLVKDLKEVCRECIQENMSSETFCEAVQLALRCGDEDLLQSAFDYFATNFRHIVRSVEWQRYIEENPREANEIFIRSFGPP